MRIKPYLPAMFAALLVSTIALWVLVDWVYTPLPAAPTRQPSVEGSLAEQATRSAVRDLPLETQFRQGVGTPGVSRGSWPCFRGPERDAIVRDDTPLADAWPAGGPPEQWRVALGEGHAGPAIMNGRVYILDYDEELPGDRLRCLSFESGEEIWSRAYNVHIKRNHGISRTVPAVSDDVVVTIGPKCHMMACDSTTGQFLWGFDMAARYGTEIPLWYTGQCPLIREGAVIIAPGGNVLLSALDLRTGETIWETPNPVAWEMSHASIAEMTVDHTAMFIYPAIGGLVGIAAAGPDAGALLWTNDQWDHAVVAPSPLPIGDDRFLCTAGYGSGSAIFKIERIANEWRCMREQVLDRKTFACEQQTPIYRDGKLYTIMPKDAGKERETFLCMRDNGMVLWSSGNQHRFGLGPFIYADGKFLILRDDGELVLAQESESGYEALAAHQVLRGRDAWAPLALVGGRLLMRDQEVLVCLDLRPRP